MDAKMDQLITLVAKMSEDILSIKEDIKEMKAKQKEHSQCLNMIQKLTLETAGSAMRSARSSPELLQRNQYPR